MSIKTIALATTAFAVLALTPVIAPVHAADPANKPDAGTMDRADSGMKKVLEAFQKLGPKPIETSTVAEARQQPTMTDAVNAVLRDDGKNPDEMKAKLKVTTKDLMYPAADGSQQAARVYFPEDAAKADKPLPVVVYYHGGGFVIADINVYDAAPRNIAKMANAIVVSAEYRHAPEAKFPAQHQDAFAAYQWVLANAASWGGDPHKIAVMGESAGGNLAANVAIMARDKGVQMPVHMALIYPVASTSMATESYIENANAKPLNKAMMQWFVQNTISSDADKQSQMLNLVAANLKGLPSATIITAEIDPLRSEGEELAKKLEAAGSKVDYRNYEGVTHEFFGTGLVVSNADAAVKKVSGNLDDAFDAVK